MNGSEGTFITTNNRYKTHNTYNSKLLGDKSSNVTSNQSKGETRARRESTMGHMIVCRLRAGAEKPRSASSHRRIEYRPHFLRAFSHEWSGVAGWPSGVECGFCHDIT